VLVVDDELHMREIGCDLLKTAGYSVYAFEHGQAALSYFLDNQESVAAVILDMIMPVMDGRETALALLAINPHLPILLTSGYALDSDTQRLLEHEQVSFLRKPFRRNELLQALADCFYPGETQ
jgi:CheY-like chemotaxis protein